MRLLCYSKQIQVVPKVYLFLLSLPFHLISMSSQQDLHFISRMSPELFDSLASVFISRLVNSFKIKTKQTLLAAPEDWPFPKCLDDPSVLITSSDSVEVWLTQTSVTFIFTLSPFPLESWTRVERWNHGKDVEAAILGYSLSEVCIIQNRNFYTYFQFNVTLSIISIAFIVIFIKVGSICYVKLSALFSISPHGCSSHLLPKYLFIILLICNSTVDQKYKMNLLILNM